MFLSDAAVSVSALFNAPEAVWQMSTLDSNIPRKYKMQFLQDKSKPIWPDVTKRFLLNLKVGFASLQ